MAPAKKNQQQPTGNGANVNNPLFAPPFLGYTANNAANNNVNMQTMAAQSAAGLNYGAQWDLYNNLNAVGTNTHTHTGAPFNVNAPSVPATAADLNVNLAAAAELCYGTNGNATNNNNDNNGINSDASNAAAAAFDPFNLISGGMSSAPNVNVNAAMSVTNPFNVNGVVNPFFAPGNVNVNAQQQQAQGLNHALLQHASIPAALGAPMAIPSASTNNSHAGNTSTSAATTTATASTASTSSKTSKQAKKRTGVNNLADDGGLDDDAQSHLPSTLPPNASAEEKAAFHRERNRQHARSTRARKKAYVNKLKELVEHLHMERTEEARKRRVAASTLAELTRMRKGVVLKFLELHSNATTDPNQFMTILEPTCWFRQPITPYRWFNRAEIIAENRVSNGIPAIIADCASMGVMITNIGCRSSRWSSLRRCEFLGPMGLIHMNMNSNNGCSITGGSAASSHLQHVVRGAPQHAISSLSSNTCDNDGDSSGQSSAPECHSHSNSSSGNNNSKNSKKSKSSKNSSSNNGNLLHDYHAQPLPDPLLSDDCSDDSNASNNNNNTTSNASNNNNGKKSALSVSTTGGVTSLDSSASIGANTNRNCNSTIATTSTSTNAHNITNTNTTTTTSNHLNSLGVAGRKPAPMIPLPPFVGLGKRSAVHMPLPIAPAPIKGNNAAGTTTINGTTLTKRLKVDHGNSNGRSNVKANNNTCNAPKMTSTVATYNLNQDDMLLTGNTLMCPFTFRTRNGIHQGALAEVIQPGMLRVTFSPSNNRLSSIEMVFDAMGFMQQLERANGSPAAVSASAHTNTNTNTNTSNSTATADANSSSTCNNSIGMDNEHDSGSNSDVCSSNNNNPNNPNAINTASESLVVPNGLEMALQPNPEARVITLADPPYSIVSVNEGFVRLAKYTQLDAEGKTIDDLLSTSSKVEVNVNVNSNNKNNMPPPDSNCNTSPSSSLNVSSKQALTLSSALLSRGDSTHPCTTTLLHTDKKGKSFANFISSYPLTNAANQVTHLLHVCRELRGMHMDSHNAYSSNTLGLHAALPTLPHAHAHGNHNQHDNALAGENGSVSVYSGSGGS